jgi:replicative DNA helicase
MSADHQDKTIPWSAEAEQSVLGSLLLDNASAFRLSDVGLKTEDFYTDAHRLIWSTIFALTGAGHPADVLTVTAQLGDQAASCGGMTYLNDLAQSVPSASNIKRYAQIVVEKAQRRALVAAGGEVQSIAQEEGDPAQLLDRAQSILMGLQRQDSRSVPVGLAESITARTERWEALGKGEVAAGMRTRIPGLDRLLGGGLQGGRVVVLAARPSIGKTSLGVQIGLNVAEDGNPVLVLSQEMPRGDLTDRIAANLGRVSLELLTTGVPPADRDTWSRVLSAIDKAAEMPLEIDDQPALSLLAIRGKAQMAKAQRGLKVLVLDYLQLCAAADRKASRHHQIEEISRGLKTLAKELDICVIVLSQINRDVVKTDREPTLADLKESGAIEEDADVVLLLHPKGNLSGGAQLLACIVPKNRQGKKGRVALRFDGDHQHWGECDMDVSPAEPQRHYPRSRDNGL